MTPWIRRLALGLTVLSASVRAHVGLPLEFEAEAPWQPRPHYLDRPATNYAVRTEGGISTLTVAESGRGMKFEYAFHPFDCARHEWLAFRYRAEAPGPGYALWAQGAMPGGGMVASMRDLQCDGAWHEAAVSLAAAGVTGIVACLLTELHAGPTPASIAFDWIRLCHEPPPGAKLLPSGVGVSTNLARGRVEAVCLAGLEPQPGWLARPDPGATAVVTGGVVRLSVTGADRGMKWKARLPGAIDLSASRFASIRYRARSLAPWNDYFIWLSGVGADGRQNECRLIPLDRLDDDGRWHVAVVPVRERFVATLIALQACALRDRAEVELDRIDFSGSRPTAGPDDLVETAAGWDASILPPGTFNPMDLASTAARSRSAVPSEYELDRWIAPGRFTANGCPFVVDPAGTCAPSVSGATNEIRIGRPASELFFVLAVQPPDVDFAGVFGESVLHRFANPERLVVRVRYADGAADEHIPVCLATGRPEVRSGIGVYGVTCGRTPRAVESVAVISGYESARIAVAALTVSSGPPRLPDPTPLVLAVAPGAAAAAPPRSGPGAAATVAGDELTIESADLRVVIRTAPGIALRGLEARRPAGLRLSCAPGPLFELVAGGCTARSDRVRTGAVVLEAGGRCGAIPFDATAAGVAATGALRFAVGPGDGVRFELDARYCGATAAVAAVRFPLLRGVAAGTPADTWYLWACKGGIVHTADVTLANDYGGEYPLQVADVFDPRAGGGLALQTRDLACLAKTWRMRKGAEGIDWTLDYRPSATAPGASLPAAPAVLNVHAGGWREALGLYREWTRTWYRPAVPRKPWFRECFNYRQHLAWSDLRDRTSGEWRVGEVIRNDREQLGGIDYLHIFDFGESRVFGRVGDYDHYDELGGVHAMAAAVAGAKAMGVPVGVYIEGYLCDSRSAWGASNVLARAMRRADGVAMTYPGTVSEYFMCPAEVSWRARLAGIYARVASELQPDGMYIDEYGFTDAGKVCYAATHGHAAPAWPMPGERATTEAIRRATPPDIATLTEETPCDVVSQFQDGALGYSVAFNRPELAPHRVDLFRFMFPDFKVFQLVTYNPIGDGNWELFKFPFFNGEGLWTCQRVPDEICPEARAFLRRAFGILREHRAAFSSPDVEPLVPTLSPGIYANRFATGRETVWTLYHDGASTRRGDVLRVPHRAGTRYTDAFAGTAIEARIEGESAVLPLTLGPKSVGCMVATRP